MTVRSQPATRVSGWERIQSYRLPVRKRGGSCHKPYRDAGRFVRRDKYLSSVAILIERRSHTLATLTKSEMDAAPVLGGGICPGPPLLVLHKAGGGGGTGSGQGGCVMPDLSRPNEGSLFDGGAVEIADKTLAGHVLAREHTLVKGLDARGRPLGVACSPDGKALPQASLEVLEVAEWPRLGALLNRFRAGCQS